MNAQDLKNSILQLAIQGKLVEQREEEGTAKELLKKIDAEKKHLIKEGKIKKQKALPDIKEDEIPFDIPESWEWVRLSEIIDVRDGTHDTPKYVANGVPLVTSKNLKRGELDFDNVKLISIEDSEKINMRSGVDDGDILFAMIGSIGNPVLVNKTRDFSIKNMALFKPIKNTIFNMEYLLNYLQLEQENMKRKAAGGVQSFVSLTFLRKYLVPLPPLEEQRRIVEKIEELMPYVDKYDVAYSEVEELNKKFPEDMQKSILQYAIQGKLVEQREEDGTAKELIQRIEAEKKQLIKEGKIKKTKALPEITEDEIPFDIPENWKWVRLSQIAILENGDRSGKYPVEKDYVEFGVPFFGAKDMSDAVMSFDNVRYISEEKFAELGNGKLQDKDFICLLRGSVGKCALFIADERHHTGFICAQMVIIRCINIEICHYLASFLTSPFYLRYIDSKVTGTAVRQLPAKELGNVLIPLPPLAEQKRIVAKLEEILPLCERLK